MPPMLLRFHHAHPTDEACEYDGIAYSRHAQHPAPCACCGVITRWVRLDTGEHVCSHECGISEKRWRVSPGHAPLRPVARREGLL